ncbi:MAG: ABC transporter ATP-binding protein [Aminipila sp.]
MAYLNVENLSVNYGEINVLNNISFEVEKGEIVSIVGESGSGKSTLLNAIQGFLPENGVIEQGHILLEDVDLVHKNQKYFEMIRGNKIGTIFQEPGSTLNPVRKIGVQFVENLKYKMKMNKHEAMEYALFMLDKVRLKEPEKVINQYPFELSGGMKQRVSIAMAMSLKPSLLIGDEPTSALDATVQKQIIDEFIDLRKEFNTTILLVTHNLALASYISDRIMVLYQGNTVEYGSATSILTNPSCDYTKKLVRDIPRLRREECSNA